MDILSLHAVNLACNIFTLLVLFISVARDVRMFTLLEKILGEQRDQRRILNLIREKLEDVTEEGTGGVPEGVDFPLKSMEDLTKLEELLNDKSTFTSVVSKKYFSLCTTKPTTWLLVWHGSRQACASA